MIRGTGRMFETEQVLAALSKTEEFEFSQTGSRYFGHANIWSDWDFFTKDSVEVERFLVSLGLKPDPSNELLETYPDDQEIVMVYRGHGVDVQLVKDLEVKSTAQTILAGMDLIRFSSKEEHKFFWRRAYKTARQIHLSILP